MKKNFYFINISYDKGKIFWETFLDLEGERNCGRDFYFTTHGTRTP